MFLNNARHSTPRPCGLPLTPVRTEEQWSVLYIEESIKYYILVNLCLEIIASVLYNNILVYLCLEIIASVLYTCVSMP